MSSIQSAEAPLEFFLPASNFNDAIKAIASSAIVITITHLVVFYHLKSRSKQYKLTGKEAFKLSYQVTNFLVNLSFGLYGFITCIQNEGLVFSKISEGGGISQHVFGYESYYLFCAFQVGYNLWSLPVGILFVNEPPSMITHHISVIIICSLTATSHFGFRIHAPFFLGMFEVSSVPLAIMNYLKDHHDWTMKNCKRLFAIMKVMFALMFFTIRIFLGTGHMHHVIRAAFWATFQFSWDETSYNSRTLRTWVGFVLVAQIFMALLQYWWGYLILKTLARIVAPKASKRKKVD